MGESDGELEEGAPATTGNGQQVARSDGGAASAKEDLEGAIYDLRPPDGYDGVAISIRDPDYFDPYPVTRQDVKAAAEWFEQAGSQATDVWMKGLIVGLLVFGGIWMLFEIVPWLLAQIGGSGGGGQTVSASMILAIVRSKYVVG